MREVSLQLGPDVAKQDAEHHLYRKVVCGDAQVVVLRDPLKHLVDLIRVHRVADVMPHTGVVERVLPFDRVVQLIVGDAELMVEQVC